MKKKYIYLQVQKAWSHSTVCLSDTKVESRIRQLRFLDDQRFPHDGVTRRRFLNDLEAFGVFWLEGGHVFVQRLLRRPDPVDEDGQVGLELAEELDLHSLHHSPVVRLVNQN